MTTGLTVGLAEGDAELRSCWPVMRQLRPHLDEASFLHQVRRQASSCGYRLAYVRDRSVPGAGPVLGCAGFRVTEFLAWGHTLYVDDLVTDEAHRSRGVGGVLLDWLVAEAKAAGCAQVHLDSGVQRFGAHRFYLTHGMDITAHHFRLEL
jgi:GNAT superfamily N-acetyltransferase